MDRKTSEIIDTIRRYSTPQGAVVFNGVAMRLDGDTLTITIEGATLRARLVGAERVEHMMSCSAAYAGGECTCGAEQL